MSSVIFGILFRSGPLRDDPKGFKFGTYYGVYSFNAVTYYATDRCSAFLAEWSARGACW
jgi:hypothetical protein